MQSTEESQAIGNQLRDFRRRCILFVAPLILLAAPPLGILFASRESFVSHEEIVQRCADRQLLVGFAYNEQGYGYLKYHRIKTLPRQSVVALGSSRVLGFREEMFTGSFYNAGYTIVSPWDFRSFLELVPDAHLPEILILGLDQFMFNVANNRQRPPKDSTAWTAKPRDDFQSALRLIPDVYKDLVRGRIRIGDVLAHAADPDSDREVIPVGLNGLINSQGFRNDGSFVYGAQVKLLLESRPDARDYHFVETLGRVKSGRRRFNFGAVPDQAAVDEIGHLLDYCSSRNVHVVAFLPPYADAVWRAMQDSGEYEYISKIESGLRDSFDRHDFELYAFQCMSDCDASDFEAIDGFHAGGNVYLKILIHMLQEGSALNEFADLKQLQDDSQHIVNRYTAYPEPVGAMRRLAASESENTMQ